MSESEFFSLLDNDNIDLFYEKLWDFTFDIIYSKVNEFHIAEDLTQNFFIVLIQSKILNNKITKKNIVMKIIDLINEYNEKKEEENIYIEFLRRGAKFNLMSNEKYINIKKILNIVRIEESNLREEYILNEKETLFLEINQYIYTKPEKGVCTRISKNFNLSMSNVYKIIQRLRMKMFIRTDTQIRRVIYS